REDGAATTNGFADGGEATVGTFRPRKRIEFVPARSIQSTTTKNATHAGEKNDARNGDGHPSSNGGASKSTTTSTTATARERSDSRDGVPDEEALYPSLDKVRGITQWPS